MDFAPNEDQITLNSALDKLVAQYQSPPTDFRDFALVSPDLDHELEQGGFFEAAAIPELGPVSASMMTERLARLPYATGAALSLFLSAQLGEDVERPIAVIENGRPGRFVDTAKTLLIIDDAGIGYVKASDVSIEAVDSLYAYPMAKLTSKATITPLPKEKASTIRKWMQVALASEAAGLMQAALDAATEHLTLRKQFGRPLGSFQGVQHRLAECAVLTRGVKLLALKAAGTGDSGDAAVSAYHAQDSATRIVYDLHQFMGAMGMTLEFPLHLWTYRLKALLSELDGRSGQAQAVAEHCFSHTSEGALHS